MSRRSCFPLLVTAVGLTAAGCDREGSVVSPGQRRSPELNASAAFPGVVTDPARSSTAGATVTAGAEVVYVSVPPGVVASG